MWLHASVTLFISVIFPRFIFFIFMLALSSHFFSSSLTLTDLSVNSSYSP